MSHRKSNHPQEEKRLVTIVSAQYVDSLDSELVEHYGSGWVELQIDTGERIITNYVPPISVETLLDRFMVDAVDELNLQSSDAVFRNNSFQHFVNAVVRHSGQESKFRNRRARKPASAQYKNDFYIRSNGSGTMLTDTGRKDYVAEADLLTAIRQHLHISDILPGKSYECIPDAQEQAADAAILRASEASSDRFIHPADAYRLILALQYTREEIVKPTRVDYDREDIVSLFSEVGMHAILYLGGIRYPKGWLDMLQLYDYEPRTFHSVATACIDKSRRDGPFIVNASRLVREHATLEDIATVKLLNPQQDMCWTAHNLFLVLYNNGKK